MRHSPPKPQKRAANGFTLMELLAVIAIVAILAALLFPVLSRGSDSARSSKCLGNLRQLAAASALYSAENDGRLVPTCQSDAAQPGGLITWRGLLLPYASGNAANPDARVFICAADTLDSKRYSGLDGTTKRTGRMPTSYGINGYGINVTSYHDYLSYAPGRKALAIPHPSATIFLCDIGIPDSATAPVGEWTERKRLQTTPSFGYARMPSQWTSTGAADFSIYPRHKGTMTNVLFYDGHVTSLDLAKEVVAYPPADAKCLYDYH
jgi:prepilin-type N-terminal cleavage/methylation domain-containing protein/prepilin-type processing-associated H-X9-DG protein